MREKISEMRKAILFITCAIWLQSCNQNQGEAAEASNSLGDTITTSSGLKYLYLKRGEGNRIDTGSKVAAFTELYLNEEDTVFWSTATMADSSFTFIHAYTSLIAGFSELNSYLREGDEVVAILPDSLAYGVNGRGGVPGGATLIYDPYIVRSVSPAKEMLTDTLYQLQSRNPDSARDFYAMVRSSELSSSYHYEVSEMMDFLERLRADSVYAETYLWTDFLEEHTSLPQDLEYLNYFRVMALEAEGRYAEAIAIVEPLSRESESPDFWISALNELRQKTED